MYHEGNAPHWPGCHPRAPASLVQIGMKKSAPHGGAGRSGALFVEGR